VSFYHLLQTGHTTRYIFCPTANHVLFHRTSVSRGAQPTIQFHLAENLRKRGDIPHFIPKVFMTSYVVKHTDSFTLYHYPSVSQWLQICHHLSLSDGCTDRPRNLGVHFVTTRQVIILNAPKTDSSEINPFIDCLALEDGTEKLSRNVGNQLQIYFA
jgi:hypothetical protein